MKFLKKDEVKQLLENVKLVPLTKEQLSHIKGGDDIMKGKPAES
jgi:DNA-directed RNA polymerase subunit H (RpoH/RPB5)